MRRRQFIALLGGTAASWSLAADAQQQAGKQPRIGIISVEPGELTEAFSQGLREDGYVDGQNIILDTRYYHGSLERIDEFARELVALKCSVIVAGSPYAIRAVLKETNTIPTVGIDLESDPVANASPFRSRFVSLRGRRGPNSGAITGTITGATADCLGFRIQARRRVPLQFSRKWRLYSRL
jgi:hypothetical protein